MSIRIINGIQLPAFDVEMLTLGKAIAVPFKQYLREGTVFWLYPSQQIPFDLTSEQYYKSEYLTYAGEAMARYAVTPLQLAAWGRCDRHLHINLEQKHLIPTIAQSTVWNLSALEDIFEKYQILKLLIVRVYRLSNPCIVNVPAEAGAFYWPHSEDMMTMGNESDRPVVSEASFKERKALLLAGETYPHVDLETLQIQVAQLSLTNPAAKQLEEDIKIFLGWSNDKPAKLLNPDLAWIKNIAALGDRSIELDEKKSNYQAGTDFENIARRGLEFLGFKVEEAYKGGAGGLDLYCSNPYPLVSECKAGKSIPDSTVEELDRIGKRHLKENYLIANRLIVGPGKPTKNLQESAQISKISIINAMTLQKLVELQAKYPNSVNLIELKQYLEPGKIDQKIDEYIEKLLKQIRRRSLVIEAVKEYQTSYKEKPTANQVRIQYNATFGKNSEENLNSDRVAHDLLIELSSPLTGYLGREEGSDWESDRFYFLRDLLVD